MQFLVIYKRPKYKHHTYLCFSFTLCSIEVQLYVTKSLDFHINKTLHMGRQVDHRLMIPKLIENPPISPDDQTTCAHFTVQTNTL